MSRKFLAIRIWLILIVIAISLVGQSVYAQGGTVVRVDPASSSAKLNDPVTLAIKVDNIANLTAFELHLSFNPAVLEVTSVSSGGFVFADFKAQDVFDNSAGTIDYAAAQMNRSPATGSGTLLTIVFKAKANGISTVTLHGTSAVPTGLLLSDQNGTAIAASWSGGSVNVGNASAPTATQIPPTATQVPPTATPITPGAPTATPITPGAPTATPVTPTPVTPGAATATKTPTATALPTTTPAPAVSRVHVVQFGESLYCIGRSYKISPWAIASANGIWWPYIIYPSQSLKIPTEIWSPIPVGRVCPAQFSTTGPVVTPTVTPATAVPTAVGPTAVPTAVGSTPVPPTPAPGTGCRAYYVVKFGDTLYHIATTYGTTYQELARVNSIWNPRLIFPGQQLCIP